MSFEFPPFNAPAFVLSATTHKGTKIFISRADEDPTQALDALELLSTSPSNILQRLAAQPSSRLPSSLRFAPRPQTQLQLPVLSIRRCL